ncbi:MAG: hypothetical protein U0892_08705 [Pirellulales bacterium]
MRILLASAVCRARKTGFRWGLLIKSSGFAKIEKDKTSKQRAKDRRVTDFSLKESSRWLEMFQSSEQLAMLHPNTQFVHVADSECDIHETWRKKVSRRTITSSSEERAIERLFQMNRMNSKAQHLTVQAVGPV